MEIQEYQGQRWNHLVVSFFNQMLPARSTRKVIEVLQLEQMRHAGNFLRNLIRLTFCAIRFVQ